MDIASYQLNERLAKSAIPSWRLMAIQGPHVFRSVGFPIDIQSSDELFNLLDTMHENRFDKVITELEGLDDADLELLLLALVDYCKFFRVNFPGKEAPIPLSTMIAHLGIAKKLRGLGNAKRILEIGPGCGYLSFFLRAWKDLIDYSQIESAASFYILQNLVNKHVFSYRFRDHAQGDWEARGVARIGNLLASEAQKRRVDFEMPARLPLNFQLSCNHYPWWLVDQIGDRQFDVVTSNANLNEFTEGAFFQYVRLIDRCLASDGCLLIQDLGGGPLPFEIIMRELMAINLAPVVAMKPSESVVAGKEFAFTNYLFVRQNHPKFAKYNRPKLTLPLFDLDDPFVRGVYSAPRTAERRKITFAQVLQVLANRLADSSEL